MWKGILGLEKEMEKLERRLKIVWCSGNKKEEKEEAVASSSGKIH